MSRFIVGDIHGSYSKLMSALESCGFSDSDTLYCTGDIGDRHDDVRRCIDFLMSLGDRFKCVIGNHDIWAYQYLTGTLNRYSCDTWEWNGGQCTTDVLFHLDNEEKEEVTKWYGSFPYIIEEDDFRLIHTLTYTDHLNMSKIPLSEIRMSNIEESGILDNTYGYDRELFDRNLLLKSKYFHKKSPDPEWAKKECSLLDDKLTVIGHTAITGGVLYDKEMNVCDIDTGGFCTWNDNQYWGKITVLNIDTRDFVDSTAFKSNLEDVKVQY